LSELYYFYLLVKYFKNIPERIAPMAPPIGKNPIRSPIVELCPANYPK